MSAQSNFIYSYLAAFVSEITQEVILSTLCVRVQIVSLYVWPLCVWGSDVGLLLSGKVPLCYYYFCVFVCTIKCVCDRLL